MVLDGIEQSSDDRQEPVQGHRAVSFGNPELRKGCWFPRGMRRARWEGKQDTHT